MSKNPQRTSRSPKISDEEERELIAFSDEEGWVSVDDVETARTHWQEVAKRTLDSKRRRISLMVPERDLLRLKARAAEKGMPYQTLINSILHKYVER